MTTFCLASFILPLPTSSHHKYYLIVVWSLEQRHVTELKAIVTSLKAAKEEESILAVSCLKGAFLSYLVWNLYSPHTPHNLLHNPRAGAQRDTP